MIENIDNLFEWLHIYDRIREAWWIWKKRDEAFSLHDEKTKLS